MAANAWELIVIPTCLAVALGAVLGFALLTSLRGVELILAARGGRPPRGRRGPTFSLPPVRGGAPDRDEPPRRPAGSAGRATGPWM